MLISRAEPDRIAAHPAAARSHPVERVAYATSVPAILLMALASGAGLWLADLYPDIPWAAQALRGGDLVTLAVGVPVLSVALIAAARGSRRARLVWAGMLGYAIYTYAYVVFGAQFNDLFLVHVAILSLSVWSLICVLATVDVTATAALYTTRVPARAIALFFGAVALTLAGMWTYFSLRQALTGELPGGAAPPSALHMVYATDLTFFVVPLAVAAVLLWRRTPWGYALGTVMGVVGSTYLINLMSAAAFQAHRHVAGVPAFSPLSLGLCVAFVAATLGLIRPRKR